MTQAHEVSYYMALDDYSPSHVALTIHDVSPHDFFSPRSRTCTTYKYYEDQQKSKYIPKSPRSLRETLMVKFLMILKPRLKSIFYEIDFWISSHHHDHRHHDPNHGNIQGRYKAQNISKQNFDTKRLLTWIRRNFASIIMHQDASYTTFKIPKTSPDTNQRLLWLHHQHAG